MIARSLEDCPACAPHPVTAMAIIEVTASAVPSRLMRPMGQFSLNSMLVGMFPHLGSLEPHRRAGLIWSKFNRFRLVA
jgi:hypothetical protein